ncbi:MAG: N-acetyltransferase [Flavobacteriaceae bacterium TMED42]|nr:MAG: N-acetyltransferase [Flavobacteriaceae bacterium TMED42]|tara:strand:- start:161 stop:667 length:507 start_codon:yes stop_codon:yes gene_type:complete
MSVFSFISNLFKRRTPSCATHSPQIKDVNFGEGIQIVNPVNVYGCSLGNNVFVGPFVEIQKNVIIGSNTKIQSHSFICEFVTIGEKCFIGHGVMFVNDLFQTGCPANGDRTLWKSTNIEDNVSIGSNATILPVKVCSNVVIGSGSVVTKDIEESGIYAGNPAKLLRKL